MVEETVPTPSRQEPGIDHAHSVRRTFARALDTIVVPYGFTLTVSCALAATIGSGGYPGAASICLFAAGGSFGYCALVCAARAQRAALHKEVPDSRAMYNLVPAPVVVAVVVTTSWVSIDWVRFLIAGLCSVVFYVSAFTVVESLRRAITQRRHLP